jgi:uncharacterized protein DUF4082
MTDRLWTVVDVPAAPDGNDGGAAGITTATTVQLLDAGTITGIQFRATTTVVGTDLYTVSVWRVDTNDAPIDSGTGTMLASATVLGSALTPGAYNDVPFATPVTITPLTTGYRCEVWSPNPGRYVASGGFFAPADVLSAGGYVKAWHGGDDTFLLGSIAQGTFLINAPHGYANGSFNASSYFVGPIFEPTGSPLATPGPIVAPHAAAIRASTW